MTRPRDDLRDVGTVLADLDDACTGPAPAPTAELAALLAEGLTPAPRRHVAVSAGMAGKAAAAALVALSAVAAAEVADILPGPVDRTVRAVVDRVMPFDLPSEPSEGPPDERRRDGAAGSVAPVVDGWSVALVDEPVGDISADAAAGTPAGVDDTGARSADVTERVSPVTATVADETDSDPTGGNAAVPPSPPGSAPGGSTDPPGLGPPGPPGPPGDPEPPGGGSTGPRGGGGVGPPPGSQAPSTPPGLSGVSPSSAPATARSAAPGPPADVAAGPPGGAPAGGPGHGGNPAPGPAPQAAEAAADPGRPAPSPGQQGAPPAHAR